MKYICPFCYKPMPQGYEPSGWGCCGEVGHAVILPECPKCGAESLDLPLSSCVVCGWRNEAESHRTPITNKIIADADACPETRIVFLIKNLANKCKEFEQLYNAALICAGVASKERGEWAVERDDLQRENHELRHKVAELLLEVNRVKSVADGLETALANSYAAQQVQQETIRKLRAALERVVDVCRHEPLGNLGCALAEIARAALKRAA